MTTTPARIVIDLELAITADGGDSGFVQGVIDGFLQGVIDDLHVVIGRNNNDDDIVDSWDARIVDLAADQALVVVGGPYGFAFYGPVDRDDFGEYDGDRINAAFADRTWWVVPLKPMPNLDI